MQKIHKDIIAGLAVFLVAMPLCLGIALASGAPMAAGLIGGIMAGLVIGPISGSHTSVSGPAAGLAAIVLTGITEIGAFDAFLVAVVLAGVIQLILAWAKAGGIASFFPTSVISGLLTSIGIILILKQIPHAVGHDKNTEGDLNFIQSDNENTFSGLLRALEQLNFGAILITIICLLIMIYWVKLLPKKISGVLPASLIVVIVAILLNELFLALSLSIAVDPSHCVQLPEGLSIYTVDKLITWPDFSAISNLLVWKVGITLAAVASLETLLNIEASDKLDPYKRTSPPNRELVAQGFGNVASGIFGGLPITSVIVRTSVNINSGGQTKKSAIFHGIYLIVFILIFPALLSKIPLAALAAILILTGFKLVKISEFKAYYAKGWDQFLPFIVTIIAIVFTDILFGVIIGLITAIFFIVRSNFRNPFIFIREEYQNRLILKLELSQQVSFFHKAALENTIDKAANNSHILIDGSRTEFLDNDIRETLEKYKRHGKPEKEINFSFKGFNKKHNLPDEINFQYVLTKQSQAKLTPDNVLSILKKGNSRFVNGQSQKIDHIQQLKESSTEQFPTSVILGCIDSRASTDIIFDQGFGDIVNIRVAGNIINDDILGSIEYSCKVFGTKLVVVLGHVGCGAVNAVFSETPIGKTQAIIDKIKISLPKCEHIQNLDEKKLALTKENINHSLSEIKKDPNLNNLISSGTIKIIGALYDINTGVVTFYDDKG